MAPPPVSAAVPILLFNAMDTPTNTADHRDVLPKLVTIPQKQHKRDEYITNVLTEIETDYSFRFFFKDKVDRAARPSSRKPAS